MTRPALSTFTMLAALAGTSLPAHLRHPDLEQPEVTSKEVVEFVNEQKAGCADVGQLRHKIKKGAKDLHARRDTVSAHSRHVAAQALRLSDTALTAFLVHEAV